MRRRISICLRSCPSVRPSVGPSVPRYFRRWKVRILGASCAVYPALFQQGPWNIARLKNFCTPATVKDHSLDNTCIFIPFRNSIFLCSPNSLFWRSFVYQMLPSIFTKDKNEPKKDAITPLLWLSLEPSSSSLLSSSLLWHHGSEQPRYDE